MIFFGCGSDGAGHYAWAADGILANKGDAARRFLERRDAVLAPKDTLEQGKAVLHRFGNHFCVLAFWDYSVDDRPGSNAMFFLSAGLTGEQALTEAAAAFPKTWKRFPKVEIIREEYHPDFEFDF